MANFFRFQNSKKNFAFKWQKISDFKWPNFFLHFQIFSCTVHKKVAIGKIHNYTATNMRVMRWDDDLATSAQKWADSCPMNHSGVFGENIFWQFGDIQLHDLGRIAAESWAAEREIQDINSLSPFIWDVKTGHWTQMIWADTDRVSLCSNF